AIGGPDQPSTGPAQKPPTMSRTLRMRSSGDLHSSMLTVASAPNFRASFRRGSSGAPTQITRPAPISCAAATARIPIGPEPWITTVSLHVNPPARTARLSADARAHWLRQRAQPQRHVVRQLVDLGARQHLKIDIDIFGPAAPQMRRLVEAEIAAVIDRRQALVRALRIVDAVVAMATGHQRRDHHFRAD